MFKACWGPGLHLGGPHEAGRQGGGQCGQLPCAAGHFWQEAGGNRPTGGNYRPPTAVTSQPQLVDRQPLRGTNTVLPSPPRAPLKSLIPNRSLLQDAPPLPGHLEPSKPQTTHPPTPDNFFSRNERKLLKGLEVGGRFQVRKPCFGLRPPPPPLTHPQGRGVFATRQWPDPGNGRIASQRT